ncbi:cytochrome c oxidase assembly protein [Vibrio maerlii]|uniref:cytochrome c oxidase assembly protein n=1 Tax=Vibrio maerlii TaxID=2231648 RepID=UPI000E3C8166|nr:cytochrome c oxidase assembly protein [Vibrio maerlii]
MDLEKPNSEKRVSHGQTAKSNRKLSLKLCAAAIAMFGFGFALVPLYDVMCDVLGINGKTNETAVNQPQSLTVDYSRTIRVEFLSHISKGVPWGLQPKQKVLNVHPGEVIQTHYVANNNSATDRIGQAVPSVSPGLGASYFNKIECFCFNHQPLAAGGKAEMPLIFYIEPDVPDSIHTLTLSYTLFDITDQQANNQQETLQVARN